jgi:hypothetical protein
MSELRQIDRDILATGKVEGQELEALRRRVYTGGKIDRQTADFLVELHKRVQHRTPAFEKFFYQVIKDYILADGRIDAEETAWLRQMLFADNKIDDQERKFLHELKGEAKHVSPEFEALFKEIAMTYLLALQSVFDEAPHIGWWWGMLLVAAVVMIAFVVPAAVMFLLGGDSTWSAAVIVAGAVIAWTTFIAILRPGWRRAWWR